MIKCSTNVHLLLDRVDGRRMGNAWPTNRVAVYLYETRHTRSTMLQWEGSWSELWLPMWIEELSEIVSWRLASIRTQQALANCVCSHTIYTQIINWCRRTHTHTHWCMYSLLAGPRIRDPVQIIRKLNFTVHFDTDWNISAYRWLHDTSTQTSTHTHTHTPNDIHICLKLT